ncbi:MAG: YncE family protein [Bryobacteraceae bacterium]
MIRTRRRFLAFIGIVIPVLSLAIFAATTTESVKYHLAKRVTLAGEGGWDYFDVDRDTGRVFIPRDSHILVLDKDLNKLADIPGVDGAHAISFAHELNKAYLSTEASISILDLDAMKISGRVDLAGKDPDAILYDEFSNRVFTFNGGGTQDASAIDAATGKVVGTVALGGKPEFAQTDRSGHIFVNIEDKGQIVDFDAKTLKSLHTWPLAPCEDPSGLAIDIAHKRLFAGCRNQLMAILDYTSGKVLATLPIGKGTDASRFDPGTGLAFASCGQGVITVVREDSPDRFSVAQTITTESGARTMALDLKTHAIYTVTARMRPPAAATPQNPHPYPQPIPNTFTALAFAP